MEESTNEWLELNIKRHIKMYGEDRTIFAEINLQNKRVEDFI